MPSKKRAATEEGTESIRKAARMDAGRPKPSEARLPTPEPTSEATNEPALDAEEPVETVEPPEEAPVVKKEKKTVKKARPTFTTAPTAIYSVLAHGENGSCQLGITKQQYDIDGDQISTAEDLKPLISPTHNSRLSNHGIVQIALGSAHGVALTKDNKILTWGCGDFGQLGREILAEADEDEENDAKAAKDELLVAAEITNTFPADTVITQVAASASASFALTATGDVWGWGTFINIQGVMGLLPSKDRKTPSKSAVATRPTPHTTPIHLPSLKNITKLATNPHSNHLLALDSSSNIYSLGAGEANQLGRRLVERSKTNGLIAEKVIFPKTDRKTLKLVEIAVGDDNSFALDDRGRIWSWGRDDFGQLGHNDPDIIPTTTATDDANAKGKGKGKATEEDTPTSPTTPARSPGTKSDLESALPRLCLATSCIDNIARIAAGRDFAVARTQSGDLYTWGRMDGMALGHDTTTLKMADLRFVGDWERPLEAEMNVLETYNHLPYTLIRAKKVESIGVLPALPAPTAVSTHEHPALAVGPGHIMVVNTKGSVYSWGAGDQWRLGLGRSCNGGTKSRIGPFGNCSDVMRPQRVRISGCLGAIAGGKFCMLLGSPSDPVQVEEEYREPTPVLTPGMGDYSKFRMSPATARQVGKKGVRSQAAESVQSTFF